MVSTHLIGESKELESGSFQEAVYLRISPVVSQRRLVGALYHSLDVYANHQPMADLPSTGCNIPSYFYGHQIIFDIT